MLKMLKNTFFLLSVLSVSFRCVYSDNQPRITSREGDLVFQAAEDKNITIRLAGSSNFMINEVNVLESLQKASVQKSPSNEDDFATIPRRVRVLKNDVRRLTNRLQRVENRTTPVPRGRIRRLQSRIRTQIRRVTEIENKLRDDDCNPNPCQNGGTCYDTYESFHCECLESWTGKTCAQDVDECNSLIGTDLGCQNNAVCVNEPGSYRCVCTNGFTGTHCRERGTDCINSTPGELCGNGACIPANNDLGYKCICDAGWKSNNVTQSCTVDVNECLETLVACHTTCINLPGSFVCGPCPTGYTGNGVICRDIDECATNNGGCSTVPKVQCINTEGSHRCGSCPPGWVGDGRYCNQADTNECATNLCHPLARCEYISNVMVCVCPEGMTGSGYGPLGCRSGSANPCNEHKCQNGGICRNHGSSYTCICPLDFEPPYCETRNPCRTEPCLNGGTCIQQGNSTFFRCACPRDATGNLCQNKRNACGSVIRDRSGNLTYPSDGGEYKSNEACAWVIRTDDNLILNVSFSHFDVQPGVVCKDWLQINDGRSLATPLIGRFCGDQLPHGGNIISSQNTLFLWFRTDNSTNSAGFSLSWTSAAPICGEQLKVDAQGHGVIKSPGYPGKSPPNRDCEWIIEAPFDMRILLRFYEVVMDGSANCTRDSLILYDTNEVMEHVCETGVPAPKYTSSNIAKVHFQTDPFREDSLFQIHYEVVEGKPGCGGLFTEPEGRIQITLDLTHCSFLIQQPNDTRISIAFSKGELSFGLESIKIYDGKTQDDPVLAESYDESMPGKFESTGSFMLIVVTIRNSYLIRSKAVIYEANYKRVCGRELRKPQGGTLNTPNYPKPYYPGLDCEYSIIGPVNSIVNLYIFDDEISKYTDVCDDDSDYIEFTYEFGGPPERFCKDVPLHIVSRSNHLLIHFHSNTNPQNSSGILAIYGFENISCGGVLKDTNGSFELLDPIRTTNDYCEWILSAPRSHVISLDLLYTRTGTKCPTDEPDLRIFINETDPQGRLVESYCGPEKRVMTILPTNLATVFLKLTTPSFGSAVSYSVRANYTFLSRAENCGGNYSLLSGSIQSPGWPNNYFDSMDCIWVIHAPLGSKIELVPRNFSLESSSRCDDDYLEIRNGMSAKSPLIGKYCGSQIPPHIPSFTNHLYLHFHADSTFPFEGFDILFQQTSTGCGGSLNSHSGSIASPHYPEISRGPVQCDWKITVSQGSGIDLRITKLSPEADLCSNNVLVIYDGDNSLEKKLTTNCSLSDAIIRLKSSQNVVFVRYTLPEIDAAEDQQFYLDYKTNCQQALTTFEGVIESPNFPDDYPNFLRCEWTIAGRKSDTISLTFSHFELESHDLECLYDVFEVIDMKDDETLQTHKLCRNPAEILTSDGNKFVVKFSTDFSNVGKGFRLEFKRNGCGGYLTNFLGSIKSPNPPYSVDCDCEWLIEAPPGKQIVLDIHELQIETQQSNCSVNGLIVKNDKSDVRDLLRQCPVQRMPMTATSEGSTMLIRFYSDTTRSRKYFRASYRQRDAKCGGIFRGNWGAITSPNYPQNYSENTHCEWMISVENSYSIRFFFDKLELPVSTNCSKGFVEVYDGMKSDTNSKLIKRLCSEELMPPYTALSNRINVIFSSEDGPPARGFHMKYWKACGGRLTDNTGFLKSTVQDIECFWKIEAKDRGSKISLKFMHIECHCDGLNATECGSQRGVRVTSARFGPSDLEFCEHHPPDFISDGSYIAIRAYEVSFTARYSTIETACGGFLTSLRGSLASPYYPQTYPPNTECIWTIEATSGNYLELNFAEMDIPDSDGCNQAYLEVREKTENGKLLGLFCSNTPATDTIQVFGKFWIKFHSPEDGVGKGFKLSWTYAQVNEITGFNGKIQPPPLVSLRSEKEAFQWRITVPRDNVISLNFKEYNRGLQLYDGFDDSALLIDIQLSPWEVTSSTNVIFLISDNQMLENFLIEWKALSKDAVVRNDTLQPCNETVIVDFTKRPMVNLSSPGYPMGYEPNLKCQWIVKASQPTLHAVIKLIDVRLEKLGTCSADYLKISSSRNLIDWHEELLVCDKPKTEMQLAPIHGTPYLKLNFNTDSSVNRTGFTSMVYAACGGNLTGPIGRILDADVRRHVRYSVIQDENVNCTWHIAVRMGRRIHFTFQFPLNTLKNTSDLCDSYALIRDGIDDGAPILPPGRICSYKEFNGTVITTTNHASIKYYLAPQNPFFAQDKQMWNLTYREYSECGGEVRLTPYARSMNITSPQYPNVPNPHTECIWTVVGPPGEVIQADFIDRFDMNSGKCSQEFVELRDGSTELARLLGKYCIRPGTVRSSGNVLYLRYLTDIAEPRNGFKVNVSISTCGGTFTQYNNIITSSNYPAPGGYPANSVCDFVIKVAVYSQLNLTFLDINLPFDKDNLDRSDHIRIIQTVEGDGVQIEDELAVFYGNETTMPVLQIDSNVVLVRLYTFKSNNLFRGFKMKYERIHGSCYRDVSGESGTLALSITPNRSAMFVLCRWKITVPKGRRVKVDQLRLEGISLSREVTVYNDFNMLSRIINLNDSDIAHNTSIISTDNKMFIHIFGAHTSIIRRFQLVYSSFEVSNCPDDITTDFGTLSLAGLEPTVNFFCHSDFILDDAQTLTFNISRLTVEIVNQAMKTYAVEFVKKRYISSFLLLSRNVTNFVHSVGIKYGAVNMLQNDFIKVKAFEATFMKHPCGGEYNIQNNFEISLPNMASNYGAIDCAWHLSSSNQYGYDLVANFSFTLPCANEYVVVHAGPSAATLEIARLCRGATYNTTRLNTQQMYIAYHTTTYSPVSVMNLVLQRATNCGDRMMINNKNTLRFLAADYKNNLECVWYLETSKGFYLSLKFVDRFFIEDSKDCVKDYLKIMSYENDVFRTPTRHCGRNLPTAINTTSHLSEVIFRSDDSNTGDGFTIEIQKTCNAVFNVTSKPQIIESPTRWSMTTLRLRCEYILQSDSDKNILVKFKKLNIGHRNRCRLTQMSVRKRTRHGELVELGPYCQDNAVTELRASKYVALTYSSMLETGDYEIEFALEGCGGQVTQSKTLIGSLRNEATTGYIHNMNCVWNITAPEGHNIILRFDYLNMEPHEMCSMDFVAIYRGPQLDDGHREAKLCGNLTASSFYIAGNSAVVVAVSDSSITNEGFSATIVFTKACDERLTLTEANSPVDIERDFEVGSNEVMSCNYRIMGPPDFRVEVELLEINLVPQNATCKDECGGCSYLEVLDSLKGGALSLSGKYCWQRDPNPKLISSYKDVVVLANVEQQGRYRFKANARLVPSDCDSQTDYVLEDDSGLKITSKTMKNGLYPSNAHCTWKITSKQDFELRFEQFSLQNKSDVTGRCLDYVHVKYTSGYTMTKHEEHCGSFATYVVNVDTYITEASAEITFHTDESVESTGFSLIATNRAPCNRTYKYSNGIIDGNLHEKMTCLNDILLPENYTINLLFPNFYMSTRFNCSENSIRVYDKKTNRQIYEDCHERYIQRKIFTATNQVRVEVMVHQLSLMSLYYYGSHKTLPPGCGGNFEIHHGYVSSPNYQEYGNSSVCRWNFTTTSPNRIELSFNEFNMGSICRTDYLDIIEIADNGEEKKSGRFCEQNSPRVFVSESNRVAVVSVTTADFDGTGWALYFSSNMESTKRIII